MKTKLDRIAPEFLDEAESEDEMETGAEIELEMEIEIEILDSGDEGMILDGILHNDMDYEVIGREDDEHATTGFAALQPGTNALLFPGNTFLQAGLFSI